MAKPVSIYVDTNDTNKISEARITELVEKHFDLRPRAIIERFGLRKPIFAQVAAYGHFGRTDIDAAGKQPTWQVFCKRKHK